MATLVAWNVASHQAAWAENGEGSGSGSLIVGAPGSPSGYEETAFQEWEDHGAKARYWIAPAIGYSSTAVQITVDVEGWKQDDYPGTKKGTAQLILRGYKDDNGGFVAEFSGEENTYPTDVISSSRLWIGASGGYEDTVFLAHLEITYAQPEDGGRRFKVEGKCYLVRVMSGWSPGDPEHGIPETSWGPSYSFPPGYIPVALHVAMP